MIMLVSSLIIGCSSSKPSADANGQNPATAKFKAGGIVINYKTAATLNQYDANPHSVMVAVYQLNNINAFHQLAKDSAGVQQLLALTKFDPSVVGVDSFFVNVAESSTIKLDRLENVQWVGIVAGYYNMVPAQMVKEYQLTTTNSNPLTLNLFFGSNTVAEVSSK